MASGELDGEIVAIVGARGAGKSNYFGVLIDALERRYAIWVTPHGFLKAALANQPALRPAGAGTEVSFYSGAQRFVGFVNSKNQVERVRIWIKRSSGDLLIDTTYTDYATFGNASFPTRIVQTQTGQPTLELSITAVQPNARVRVPVPESFAPAVR